MWRRRWITTGTRRARPWRWASSPRYAHALDLPGLRCWPLTRYPYLVFYLQQQDHIDVWRVLHSARDVPAWLADENGPPV